LLIPAPGSEETLAGGFAAHERWAFAEVYRRYASLLYSTAYNILGDGEETQDCVHDTIARLWRSPLAYSRERGSVRSFLVVCVRNEAISRQRKQRRRQRLENRLASFPSETVELAAPDPVERDRVRRALRELPSEQRAALELVYYRHRTHIEAAAELAEPLGTVKSRIKLGLRRLAAALAPAVKVSDAT
jgi:RNA polymerase sigma-70 factor (ECF subfamily)